MNVKLMLLLSEGEASQISLEKAKHMEDAARAAVEAAKVALETAKAATGSANADMQDILNRAEVAGLQKKSFRNLIEDRVTALVNSGLFNFDDEDAVVVAPSAPRARKSTTRKAEADEPAQATEVQAAVVVEPQPQPQPQPQPDVATTHASSAEVSEADTHVSNSVEDTTAEAEPEEAETVFEPADNTNHEPVVSETKAPAVEQSVSQPAPATPSFLRNRG